MTSLSSYKKRFVFVCVFLAFCQMGNIQVLLQLLYPMFGYAGQVTAVYLLLVILSMSAGLISPQWAVQLVTQMTRQAHVRLFRHPSLAQVILPQGRTDPLAVTTALSGCIILYALFAVLLTLTFGFYTSIHVWFQCRFFLHALALQTLDGVVMGIMVFPLGYLIGLMLALLYRLGLSFTTTTGKYQDFEQNIPAYLLLGAGAGCLVWSWAVPIGMHPFLALWLAQAPQLASVFLLLLAVPRFALIGNQKSFESTTAMLDRASRATGGPDLLVLVCGFLCGIVMTLFYHLNCLIFPHHQGLKLMISAAFFSLSAGMYLAFRRIHHRQRPWRYLLLGLIVWPAMLLAYLWLYGRMWQIRITDDDTQRLLFYLLLAGTLAIQTGVMLIIGALLYSGKQIIQEITVSRSWGWARWLNLVLGGAGLGAILTVFVFISQLGSLLLLAMAMMMALISAGWILMFFRAEHGRNTRIQLAFIVTLVMLVCWSVVQLSEGWLIADAIRHPVRYETFGSGLNLQYDITRNDMITEDLGETLCFFARMDDLVRRNSHLCQMLSRRFSGNTAVIGAVSTVWPAKADPAEQRIHFLYKNDLYGAITRQLLRVNPRIAADPLYIMTRPNQQRYDLIWYIITPDDLTREPVMNLPQAWLKLNTRLKPAGVLVIDLTGTYSDQALKRLNACFKQAFPNRKQIFITPDPPAGRRPISSSYILFYTTPEKIDAIKAVIEAL